MKAELGIKGEEQTGEGGVERALQAEGTACAKAL